MLNHLGTESEARDQDRPRGRRHIPRDDKLGTQPTYMTAPFAVQQEPTRNGVHPSTQNLQNDCVYDENAMNSASVHHTSLRQLKQDRLHRGGLNIFSWNTEPPRALPPRVMRDRNEKELEQLRPINAELQRDIEVRKKFSEQSQSRFLCFGDDETARKERVKRHVGHITPDELGYDQTLHSVAENNGDVGNPIFHGRRRPNSEDSKDGGIAGFAGMGAGNTGMVNHSRRHRL